MAGVPPLKAAAFTFYLTVPSQLNPLTWQVNPTIAAGDFQVSTDDAAFANPATLPVVDPAGSRQIKVVLSAAEMNGDVVTVIGHDQVGAEWCDVFAQIWTDTSQIGTVACEVWACPTRTLTQSAASMLGALMGTQINILRGDTLTVAFTGLGNIANRTKLWWTVKGSRALADTGAIIQIEESGGLLYLNGATTTIGWGSITVTDGVAGDLTISMEPEATMLLSPQACYYDIQVLRATGAVNTLTQGQVDINPDTTGVIV